MLTPNVKTKKILIIDSDISIRFVLKKLLQRYTDSTIFTSDDGVQGLGYALIIKPDIIVIDATLPKYSGLELVDYLTTNKKFKDTEIILLHETKNTFKENELRYHQLEKENNDFPQNLISFIFGLFPDRNRKLKSSFLLKVINSVSRRIIFYSNTASIFIERKTGYNIFAGFFNGFVFLINQIITSFYLLSFFLFMGKTFKEESIKGGSEEENRFRVRMYPAIGFITATIFLIIAQIVLILLSVVTVALFSAKYVLAASYTWDGGGTDGTCGGSLGDGNKWSCATNWSSDIVPLSTDTVTFNGTSTKDATIDSSFQGTVSSLTIAAGYTGTITQARTLVVTTTFTQSAGTFTAANQALDVNSSFTLNSGGTFTASSGISSFATNFTINSGASFNHNGGTITFDGSGATFSCNNVTFNLVSFTGQTGAKTVNSNCSLPLGNNPTIPAVIILNGTLTGTGKLTHITGTFTISATGVLSGFSGFGGTYNSLIIAGGTVDFSSYSEEVSIGTFSISSGTFTAPPAFRVKNDGSNWVFTGGTFNHNNGTVIMAGYGNGIINCGENTFYSVTLSHNNGVARTVNAGCNLPLGNNPVSTGAVYLNGGKLSGTGTLTINSNGNTFGTGAAIEGFTAISIPGLNIAGANLDFSSYTSFTGTNTVTLSSGSLTLPAGGTIANGLTVSGGTFNTTTGNLTMPLIMSSGVFNAPTGNLTLTGGNSLNITGGTFNHNNGTVIASGTSGTLTCNNVVFNLFVLNTTTSTTKTVNSNCNLPLGNNPIINGNNTSYIINGTLTGTGILGSFSGGTITFNTGSALSGFSGMNLTKNLTVAGATLDLSNYTSVALGGTVNLSAGSLTLPNLPVTITNAFTQTGGVFTSSGSNLDFNWTFALSGGTFNAPSATMFVAAASTISGSPTFNHNNGTITFDSSTIATLSCNNVAFNLVSFAGQTGVKTVDSNCNLPLGANPTIPNGVILNGTISGTGTLTRTTGTLTFNTGSAITGFTGLSNGAGLTIAGATVDFTNYTPFLVPGTFSLTSGTVSLPSGADIDTALIISGGTFNAPSGNLLLGGTITISGLPTFSHNNGTIVIDGSTATLSCNNVVFNLVTIAFATGTKTINSNCTFPLGNNPTVTSTNGAAITLNGSLSATGMLTYANGTLTMNSGAALSGINELSIRALTVAGANLDMSGYNSFSQTSSSLALTLSSGSVALPINSDIDGSLIISGGTFIAPSGTLTMASNLTISGSPTFNHNNGTITFDGSSSATLTCNNIVFNLISFTHTSGTKTIGPTCNMPVGNNPTFTGRITVQGTLTGSGKILSTYDNSSAFVISGAGSIVGFDKIEAYQLTLNNASTLNLSNFTEVILKGTTGSSPALFLDGNSILIAAPLMILRRTMSMDDGNFIHNNGTVRFETTNPEQVRIKYDSVTFYNLEVTAGGGNIFAFESGFTQTIINNLSLKGTAGNILNLVAITTGSPWSINPQGSVDLEYLNVQDSNNIGTTIQAAGKNITDVGNNIGWNFNNPTITNVSPTNLTTGAFTNDNTPTFTFDITDPNVSDTVKYTIQMDNNSDFLSPEIDFTSILETQGNKSYTVSSPLPDVEYYVRIKGIDNHNGDSGYTILNSGGKAFIVDTVKPTGKLSLTYKTASTDPKIYLISTAQDTRSGIDQMIYSERNDFSDAKWVNYSKTKEYTLSTSYGLKIIYIRFRDRAGNESDLYSSLIEYSASIVTPTPQITDSVVDIATSGVIDGFKEFIIRVLNENDEPVPNTKITIAILNQVVITDENGFAIFTNVPLGMYKVLGVTDTYEFSKNITITKDDRMVVIKLESQNETLIFVFMGILLINISILIYIILLKYKNTKKSIKKSLLEKIGKSRRGSTKR